MIEAIVAAGLLAAVIVYLYNANKVLKNRLDYAKGKIKQQEKVISNAKIANQNRGKANKLTAAELDSELQPDYRD